MFYQKANIPNEPAEESLIDISISNAKVSLEFCEEKITSYEALIKDIEKDIKYYKKRIEYDLQFEHDADYESDYTKNLKKTENELHQAKVKLTNLTSKRDTLKARISELEKKKEESKSKSDKVAIAN